MDFINKLRGAAEDKAKGEANKRAEGLKEKEAKGKDVANNLRKARSSSGKLASELETILVTLGEIGAEVGGGGADLQALGAATGRLNASRVLVQENIVTLQECVEGLKDFLGSGEETEGKEEGDGKAKAKEEEQEEGEESGLAAKVRRALHLLSDILGEVTIIVDRRLPSVTEQVEELKENGGESVVSVEGAQGVGGIGKDLNDIQKRVMNIKKQAQELVGIGRSGKDEGASVTASAEVGEAGVHEDDKRKDAGETEGKDVNPEPEPQPWWSRCCCCCKRGHGSGNPPPRQAEAGTK